MVVSSFAPAKINLSLQVLCKRQDGYHILNSLVVFADFGDTLELDITKPLGLSVEGMPLGIRGENLVLKAAHNLAQLEPQVKLGHFHLIKRLPIAAGLGGGSADAAAALRLLAEVNGLNLDHPNLFKAAQGTGADVPVCLTSKPRFMGGIGDELGSVLNLTPLFAVLVNPRVEVSTADVFRELNVPTHSSIQHASTKEAMPEFTTNRAELMRWLLTTQNDLQMPAAKLCPEIVRVLSALEVTYQPQIIRLSGSGATCFALYETHVASIEAAYRIETNYTDWWVKATILG